MERLTHKRIMLALRASFAAAMLVIATSCGLPGSSAHPTQVTLLEPAPDQVLSVGVGAMIRADVTGENITRVEVLLDGQPYAILTTDDTQKGLPTFPVTVPWTPATVGLHLVQFIIHGPGDAVLLKSDPYIITVGESGGTPTPAATLPAPTAAAPAATAAQAAAPTAPATPSAPLTDTAPTAEVVATASSAADPSVTIVSETANVRSGPDVTYPVVGQLLRNATAAVRGRNADSTWWQIAFPAAAAGVGWVRADLAQGNAAASSIAVATPPVLPTAAPITITVQATGVVAQATGTPTAVGRVCDANTPEWRGADARYPFCVAKNMTWHDNQDGAHRYENMQDVPLSLSWDLWGAEGAWIVFEQDESGYCDFTKQSAKTGSEPVALTATYLFNVKDFPGGATLRIFLNVKRADGQIVQFGDMRLCVY